MKPRIRTIYKIRVIIISLYFINSSARMTISCNQFWSNFQISTMRWDRYYSNAYLDMTEKFILNLDFTIILPIWIVTALHSCIEYQSFLY